MVATAIYKKICSLIFSHHFTYNLNFGAVILHDLFFMIFQMISNINSQLQVPSSMQLRLVSQLTHPKVIDVTTSVENLHKEAAKVIMVLSKKHQNYFFQPVFFNFFKIYLATLVSVLKKVNCCMKGYLILTMLEENRIKKYIILSLT